MSTAQDSSITGATDARVIVTTGSYRLVAIQPEKKAARIILERRDKNAMGGDAWVAVSFQETSLAVLAHEYLEVMK